MAKYFCIALSAILVGAINAQVDCSKRPDLRNLKTCCKVPEPKWTNFQNQCSGQSIPSLTTKNPCFLECAFNVSNALNGNNLNMVNTRSMLTRLYGDTPAFVEAFSKGFEKCAPTVSKQIAQFKGRKQMPSPKGLSCQLLGTFYHMCAYQNVFLECPSSAWTSTSTCQSAREYITSCDPLKRASGKQRMEGNQNTRPNPTGGQRIGQNGGQRVERGRREVRH